MYGSLSFISPVGRTTDAFQTTTFQGTRSSLVEAGTTFVDEQEAKEVCIAFCFNQTKEGEANYDFVHFGSGFNTFDSLGVRETRGCNMVQFLSSNGGIPECYFWAEARAFQLRTAVVNAGRSADVWPNWFSELYAREPFITEPPPSAPLSPPSAPPPRPPQLTPIAPPSPPPSSPTPPPPPYPFDPVPVTCPMTHVYDNKLIVITREVSRMHELYYNFSLSGFSDSGGFGLHRRNYIYRQGDTRPHTYEQLSTECCNTCVSINAENGGAGGWLDADDAAVASKCQAFHVVDVWDDLVTGGYTACLFYRGNGTVVYPNVNEDLGGRGVVQSMNPLAEHVLGGR